MAEQDQSEDDEDSSPAEDLDPKAALKRKLSQANKSGSKTKKEISVDTYDAEEDYQRQRQFMAGPKKSITKDDMDAVDFSQDKGGDDIDAKKKEFLGGDDDDLK